MLKRGFIAIFCLVVTMLLSVCTVPSQSLVSQNSKSLAVVSLADDDDDEKKKKTDDEDDTEGGDSKTAGDYDLDIRIEDGKLTGNMLDENADMEETGNDILGILKKIAFFVMAAVTIIIIIVFLWHCGLLAANASNPTLKANYSKALLVIFIAMALAGSVTLWMGLAFNMFR